MDNEIKTTGLTEAEAAHAVLVAASKAALETFAQAQATEAESLIALEALRASAAQG